MRRSDYSLLERNVTQSVRLPSIETPEIEVWTADETRRVPTHVATDTIYGGLYFRPRRWGQALIPKS